MINQLSISFKSSVRYTHELTGLKKNLPYRVVLNIKVAINDGKTHHLLWVEIVSLKSYFSTFLLIYSTLKQKRVLFNYIRLDISTLSLKR